MKIYPNAHRICFTFALGLFVSLTSGCSDSGKQISGPTGVPADTCGPDSPITQPQFIEKVSPVYPRLAMLAGLEGTVWVEVFLDTTGAVIDVRIAVASGLNAGFEQASLDAAWKTTFSPAMQCGRPIPLSVKFKYTFRIR